MSRGALPTVADSLEPGLDGRHYRFRQSQFAVMLLVVIGGTSLVSRCARYAGSWKWITAINAEVIECGVWFAFALPLVWFAFQSRMSRSMRYWLTAFIVFNSAEMVLDLTDEFRVLDDVPILGGGWIVFDSHNGTMNRILVGLFGGLSTLALLVVFYLAMIETDAVRDRLAKKTRLLEEEISERQAVETHNQELTTELQHSSRLNVMGEMAAGVAHELHQPLAAIANFANGCRIRLNEGKLRPDDAVKVLHQIADEAIRAGQIVGRIKSFVQKKTPTVTLADVNTVVRDAVQLAQLSTQKSGIDIQLDLAESLPLAPIDSIEVTQVLLNLVMNGIEAIEATDKPLRTLTIQTRLVDEVNVVVSIRDTGDGVPPEIAKTIYDQFYTTKHNGLGMGLAICRSIIGRYEGRVWHESEAGVGSVFCCSIPTQDSEPGQKLLTMNHVA